MKKTYLKPEMAETIFNSENELLAGSINLDDEGGTGNPSDQGAEGDGLSKENGSFWDDED